MLATVTATLAVNAYIILLLIWFVKCFLLLLKNYLQFRIIMSDNDNQDVGHKPNKKASKPCRKQPKEKKNQQGHSQNRSIKC